MSERTMTQILRETVEAAALYGPIARGAAKLAREQQRDPSFWRRKWSYPFAPPPLKKKLEARDRQQIIAHARAHMEQVLREFFQGLANEGAKIVTEHHADQKAVAPLKPRIVGQRMSYAEYEARKAASAPPLKDPQALLDALTPQWTYLLDQLEPDFIDIAQAGAQNGLAALNVDDQEMLSRSNAVASGWAKDRAAELVGLKRLSDGTLIENPDSEYNISSTTRDDLRSIITQAFESGSGTVEGLANDIRNAAAFSADRAQMIAETEAARAETMGNRLAWKDSGMVETVNVVLSADHGDEDECDDAAEGGPYSLDDVPDLPFHPRCMCSMTIASLTGEDES